MMEQSEPDVFLPYNETSFRKAYFPWVVGAFFLSFVFELIFFWQIILAPPPTVLADETARSAWMYAWVVLLLISEGLFKGVSLNGYFTRRGRAQRSSITLKMNEVCYREVASRMSRRLVLLALEGSSLAQDDKSEYLLQVTYHIRKVTAVDKRWNGGLVVRGEIDCEIMDESYTSFYGGKADGTWRRVVHSCEIPSVFEDMKQIETKLRGMVK
jgi:hypothetical protein